MKGSKGDWGDSPTPRVRRLPAANGGPTIWKQKRRQGTNAGILWAIFEKKGWGKASPKENQVPRD